MENPWTALPHVAPFVLPNDQPPINRHNATKGAANSDAFIHADLLPEPFVGRKDAPIVLLNLNPGYSPQDATAHADPSFSAALRGNLVHRPSPYPFYLLNPTLVIPGLGMSPGYNWWSPRLARLIADCEDNGQEKVANGILCIELFGYHSRRCDYAIPKVPSQLYSLDLAAQALARGALMIVMSRRWFGVMPSLINHPNVYFLNNPRSRYITPANCNGYSRLVGTIR